MGLTDDPTNPCLKETLDTGQRACYLILSDEERAKGFVRPVRKSYIHVACGSQTSMSDKIAETYARDPKFYGGTFCAHCGSHFHLVNEEGVRQFRWSDGTGFVGE